MTLEEKIGSNLQQIRREQQLTQVSVATKAGINANTYAKIERGEQTATTPMLEALAKALNTELHEIFKFKD